MVAASYGHTKALHSITPVFSKLPKQNVLQLLKDKTKSFITQLTTLAAQGLPEPLDHIAPILKELTPGECIEIYLAKPMTIERIAYAANVGHPEALNQIAPILGQLTAEVWVALALVGSLDQVATAAVKGHPKALNLIAPVLGTLDKSELLRIEAATNTTIYNIARAASAGHPAALNQITPILGKITQDAFIHIMQRNRKVLSEIAKAAAKGHPYALNQIAPILGRCTIQELDPSGLYLKKMICRIAETAYLGFPKALNAIAAQLPSAESSKLSETIQDLLYAAPSTEEHTQTMITHIIDHASIETVKSRILPNLHQYLSEQPKAITAILSKTKHFPISKQDLLQACKSGNAALTYHLTGPKYPKDLVQPLSIADIKEHPGMLSFHIAKNHQSIDIYKLDGIALSFVSQYLLKINDT
jgi:hypothetical protein